MEQKNEIIFNLRELTDLTRLAEILRLPRQNEWDERNVIISGNARKGMAWVEMVNSQLRLGLQSQPYQADIKGKIFSCKWLTITISDLSESDIIYKFRRREYTDIVRLDRHTSTVEGS